MRGTRAPTSLQLEKYCITCGCCNYLLDYLCVWKVAEERGVKKKETTCKKNLRTDTEKERLHISKGPLMRTHPCTAFGKCHILGCRYSQLPDRAPGVPLPARTTFSRVFVHLFPFRFLLSLSPLHAIAHVLILIKQNQKAFRSHPFIPDLGYSKAACQD